MDTLILYHLPCWCHHKFCMSGSGQPLPKRIMRKRRRCAVFSHRGGGEKQPYLNRGESFIHSSKSTVIFACSRVFSLQSANVIARSGMSLEPCGWWPVSPWRAAVCRRSPCGTVTQNASSVRGRQITTPLLPSQARGVTAPRRLK